MNKKPTLNIDKLIIESANNNIKYNHQLISSIVVKDYIGSINPVSIY